MFESILVNNRFDTQSFFICFGIALLCGIICAVAASVKNRPTKSFITSLILLPMIVLVVIVMVNGNTGTGVAVMGAFSLVRFRSVPGKAKDIVTIFLAMTSGLACAAGYVYIALTFTAMAAAVAVALSFIPLGGEKNLDLHITIPETLRFANEFDDIFAEYTKNHRLVRAKTSNMGSLYVLYYKIQLKDITKMQEFIDKIRCRNGNLEISIAESAHDIEEL